MLISFENEEIKIIIKKEVINEIINVFSGIKSLIKLMKNVEVISSNKTVNDIYRTITENIININEEDLDIENLLKLPPGEYANNNIFVNVDEESLTIIIKGGVNINEQAN
jgi:hypothetical protein